MRVKELIAALEKCDPELPVAYPAPFGGREDYPKVVEQVITATDHGSSDENVRCVILNPTFAHIDRMVKKKMVRFLLSAPGLEEHELHHRHVRRNLKKK